MRGARALALALTLAARAAASSVRFDTQLEQIATAAERTWSWPAAAPWLMHFQPSEVYAAQRAAQTLSFNPFKTSSLNTHAEAAASLLVLRQHRRRSTKSVHAHPNGGGGVTCRCVCLNVLT